MSSPLSQFQCSPAISTIHVSLVPFPSLYPLIGVDAEALTTEFLHLVSGTFHMLLHICLENCSSGVHPM